MVIEEKEKRHLGVRTGEGEKTSSKESKNWRSR